MRFNFALPSLLALRLKVSDKSVFSRNAVTTVSRTKPPLASLERNTQLGAFLTPSEATLEEGPEHRQVTVI